MEGGRQGRIPRSSPAELMSENLRALWLRVVADAHREIERLRSERPNSPLDQDLDGLLAERWPLARKAAIESLAREEAGDCQIRYRAARRRLDRALPRDYPYARTDRDGEQ